MSSFDPLIQDALAREVPLRAELEPAWDDVVARARGGRNRMRPRRWKPVLAAAVVTMALAGAGVAIAAGLGAFNGIGAAQRPQTGADVIDAKTLARIQEACPSEIAQGSFYMPFCHLVLDSARLVGQLPAYGNGYGVSYGNVYVVTNTRGDLCTVIEGGEAGCGPPLSNSQPITFIAGNPSPTTGGTFVATGIATDGVTSVSFTVSGKEVTVPVKNNFWEYEEPNSHASEGYCIVAHLADGSTVVPFSETPCP